MNLYIHAFNPFPFPLEIRQFSSPAHFSCSHLLFLPLLAKILLPPRDSERQEVTYWYSKLSANWLWCQNGIGWSVKSVGDSVSRFHSHSTSSGRNLASNRTVERPGHLRLSRVSPILQAWLFPAPLLGYLLDLPGRWAKASQSLSLSLFGLVFLVFRHPRTKATFFTTAYRWPNYSFPSPSANDIFL